MSENGYATNDAFAAASQVRYADHTIPVVGKVRIRSVDAMEFIEIEEALGKVDETRNGGTPRRNLRDGYAKLFAICNVNEDGSQRFSKEDLPMLRRLDAVVSVPLAVHCLHHIQMEGVDLEAELKNLPAASGGDLPTDSRETLVSTT